MWIKELNVKIQDLSVKRMMKVITKSLNRAVCFWGAQKDFGTDKSYAQRKPHKIQINKCWIKY